MQADAQLWSDLLFRSGGHLELPKCGFHTIFYDFTPEGDPIMCHKPEQDIIIKNEHQRQTQIQKKYVCTQQQILKYHKSSTGKFRKQTKETMKQ